MNRNYIAPPSSPTFCVRLSKQRAPFVNHRVAAQLQQTLISSEIKEVLCNSYETDKW